MPKATREPSIEDLESGLAIDENHLEECSVQQPDLFYRAAKRAILEQSRRDAAKQAVAEAEAKADADARHALEVLDEKITEGKVASAVTLDKNVRAAKEALHQANLNFGLWSVLKESYVERRHALNNLTTLYTANYYGEVTSSKSATQVRDAKAHEGRNVIRKALRKET
jgi:hypothetical protein